MPVGAASFSEALRWGTESYHALRPCWPSGACPPPSATRGASPRTCRTTRTPSSSSSRRSRPPAACPASEIAIALDPATSELLDDGSYVLAGEGRTLSPAELADYWVDLVRPLPDRLDRGRHGRGGLGRLGGSDRGAGRRIQLVGDDIFVTNAELLGEGISEGVANAILIKLNQIGTLTETLDTVALATGRSYRTVISHRSGETEDDDHRRPGRGGQRRADQDRRARAAPTAWPSTTSCSGSKRTWATRRASWERRLPCGRVAGWQAARRRQRPQPTAARAEAPATSAAAVAPGCCWPARSWSRRLMLVAWFPLLVAARPALAAQRRRGPAGHAQGQDAALAQEQKNLSDSGEIGRMAREQYQLVEPRPAAVQVLPPSGTPTPGGAGQAPYPGDPGLTSPVAPSAVAPAARRRRPPRRHASADDARRPRGGRATRSVASSSACSHPRLLASMSLRGARRPSEIDQVASAARARAGRSLPRRGAATDGAPVVIENAAAPRRRHADADAGTGSSTRPPRAGRAGSSRWAGVRRLEAALDPGADRRSATAPTPRAATRSSSAASCRSPRGAWAGPRRGLKCLHAHLAAFLAGAGRPRRGWPSPPRSSSGWLEPAPRVRCGGSEP